MYSNKAQELVEETKERLPNNNEGGGKIDYTPSTRNFSASLVKVESRSPVPGEGEVAAGCDQHNLERSSSC